MKKLFTLLSAVMLTLSLSAQEFGVQAGMNMANISGEDMDGDMKMGINGGVTAALSLTDAMTLKTGVLYSTKGTQMKEDGMEMSANLSYIEIPINLSFSISDQMSLMAGPYIGLLMSAEMEVSGTGLFDGTTDMKEDTRGMDYGINVGAGFAVTDAISINAGYQMGLATLDPDGDGDSKNSNIYISVGYIFAGGY